jgi:tRNA1Val (adenine37-N6)-methyltransferase
VRNEYFQFKSFRIEQQHAAMKVTTDGCVFGALVAKNLPGAHKVLDIGTGTGLLSLMYAQLNPKAEILALEIEESTASEAHQNVLNSPWKDQIIIEHQDVKSFQASQLFNLIIVNPPFFERSMKSDAKAKNLAIHDDSLPKQTLAKKLSELLDEKGTAAVMYPLAEMHIFKEEALPLGLQCNQSIILFDMASVEALRAICFFTKSNQVGDQTAQFIIKDEHGQYTPEFTDLLKPYYLYL